MHNTSLLLPLQVLKSKLDTQLAVVEDLEGHDMATVKYYKAFAEGVAALINPEREAKPVKQWPLAADQVEEASQDA